MQAPIQSTDGQYEIKKPVFSVAAMSKTFSMFLDIYFGSGYLTLKHTCIQYNLFEDVILLH